MPDDHKAPKSSRTSATPPKLSEIGRLDNACPYCGEPLVKRPERKTRCPHCRSTIFVRMRPFDSQRVLLTAQETGLIEAEWMAFQVWTKRHSS